MKRIVVHQSFGHFGDVTLLLCTAKPIGLSAGIAFNLITEIYIEKTPIISYFKMLSRPIIFVNL